MKQLAPLATPRVGIVLLFVVILLASSKIEASDKAYTIEPQPIKVTENS